MCVYLKVRCMSVQETCLKTVTILEALKLHLNTFLINLSVYPAHPLSLHIIATCFLLFSFMHMLHIFKCILYLSLRALTDVLHRLVQLSQEEECVSTSFVIIKTLHTHKHTLLTAPLESYISHIHNQALSNGMRIAAKYNHFPHPPQINTPESPPTDHSFSYNIESRKSCCLWLS